MTFFILTKLAFQLQALNVVNAVGFIESVNSELAFWTATELKERFNVSTNWDDAVPKGNALLVIGPMSNENSVVQLNVTAVKVKLFQFERFNDTKQSVDDEVKAYKQLARIE